MKIRFWQITILALLLIVFFSGCGSEVNQEAAAPQNPAETSETILQTTEPEIELDPEWLSEKAIDEAYAYLFPVDGEKNVELAQEILLPLVEAGNAEAMYYWGHIYDWEIVDNNGEEEKESLYWHTLALEQGFPKSYLAAALNIYVESEERTNELIEKAAQAGLFEMSPEELRADGCEAVGSYYFQIKKDYQTALEWYLHASDMGNDTAMLHIGYMYYNGIGVNRDIDIALDWALKAATKGNVYAMNYYGYWFFVNNYSSEKELQERAINLLKKAADAGCASAMINIGEYGYEKGYIELDPNKAEAWYQKAADANHYGGMSYLGSYYRKRRDNHAAMEWYLKAYANGNNSTDSINYMLNNKMLNNTQAINAYFENYGELIVAKP